MEFLPTYKHIINPKLKNIYLHIDKSGELVIKSPRVSIDRIEKLLISKSKWIKKAREKVLNKKGNHVFDSDVLTIHFLGKIVNVVLKYSNKNRLDFENEDFILEYKDHDKELFVKTIDVFYKTRAKMLLPIVVDKYAMQMNVTVTKLKFRKTKTQWGSCNNKNEICLNTSLMKLPRHLIEYIVIHELCHIKHKHHQKSFWDEVRIFCPNFKEYRVQLKEFSV